MSGILKTVGKSARVRLWPFIAANAVCMSIAREASIGDSLRLGMMLSLLASYGFIVNDLKDRSIDATNNESRLQNADASTLVSVASAAGFALLVAFLAAAQINFEAVLFTAALTLGLTAYSVFVRRLLLAATLLSAALSTSPLWVPVLLFHDGPVPFHLLIISAGYLLIMSREIVLDTKDRHGDALGSRRTFATVFGAAFAYRLASAFSLLGLSVMLFAPITINGYATRQLVSVSLLCVAAVGYLTFHSLSIAASDTNSAYSRYVSMTRVSMLLIPLLVLLEQISRP